jgi:CBS domain-containing protein
MQVREAMTRDVQIASPTQSIQQVARLMCDLDAGFLPVGENDRLIGTITDRDIAVRGIAKGKGPKTAVRDVMTNDVKYCFDDEEIEHVARNMGEQQIRRLPVVDRDKRLVGVLALADITAAQGGGTAGDALEGISRAGGIHNQTELTAG